ncbi:M14 family murein peptide amidase A [Clostridium sp. MB40-C1]|uniref:M14 family murein peptide amidase A n=1 Tax=Clostridium sp. MB40-C1 TaxID=3070996 RepID=UPI0027DFA666|nr:M14 family murein peptide amidase A [Clostridium sp. MB40-C1]WMJ81499.1 M14 family murein peptide amidase A [Clostridium sp. MB40-C1]
MKNHTKLIYFLIFIIIIVSCSFIYKRILDTRLKKSKGNINEINKKDYKIKNNEDIAKSDLNNKKNVYIDEKVYIEKSVEQRELKIYVLGKETNSNKIAILGSMHGDEPQGKYIVEQLMNYIKNNPEIIKNTQIMFIPAINPDGLARCTRVNAHKIDLNRNFPTKNWEASGKNSRYYSGSKPASQPEVNVLINYINKFNPQCIINIHSPLKVINYDGVNSKKIAELMSKYNKYKIVGDIGYPTPGSFGTYFGKERNISVITLETSSEDGHIVWQKNKKSILEVIKYFDNNSENKEIN